MADTVNGWVTDPSCGRVSENDWVVAAGVGAVGLDELDDPHADTASVATASNRQVGASGLARRCMTLFLSFERMR